MQRLGDQRAGRHQQQRMAVGRRGAELAQRRHGVVAGTVLDIDMGVEALADPMRHEAGHDIGGPTGRPADHQPDRLAGQILRCDRAERRGDKRRDKERRARAAKAG